MHPANLDKKSESCLSHLRLSGLSSAELELGHLSELSTVHLLLPFFSQCARAQV